MKIHFLMTIILSLGCVLPTQATDIGIWVNVDAVSLPDINTARLLKSKLERVAVDSDISVADDNALFLSATVSPISHDVIEGGMRKIHNTIYQLILTVENPILGIQFGTHSVSLKGYGITEDRAVNEAIKELSSHTPDLSRFLKSTVYKAEEYYTQHFEDILSKARAIAASGNYDEALAILWGLPVVGVDSQVLYAEIETLYNKIQVSECSSLISRARSALALKNYAEAAEWLQAIDANSPCYSEAKQLSNKIAKNFAEDQRFAMQREDAERTRQAKMIENDKRRRHSLQTSIINSVSSIATAYLNSRQNTIYYLW